MQTYRLYKYLIYRLLFEPSVSKNVMSIYAVRRSGQHAIIDWIKMNFKSNYAFFNNVYINTHVYYSSDHTEVHYRPFKGQKTIIYNMENPLINKHYGQKSHPERGLGKYSDKKNIIILRDPFNTFASYMNAKWPWDTFFNDSGEYRAYIKLIWKTLAKEYLADSNYLKNKIGINYNLWTEDEKYRKEIAQKLGLQSSLKFVEKESTFGLGSSFKDSENKNYHERWKLYSDNDDYMELINDSELLDLSNRIFGNIPGTESLLRKS